MAPPSSFRRTLTLTNENSAQKESKVFFFGGQKVREVGRYIIGLTKGLFFKGVVQEGMSQYYNPEK